jgi:hypothetical protein
MTIDMSNNRVPYGLLTDEEKAALHEHEKAGGAFEFTNPPKLNGWHPITTVACLDDLVYRTVPLPKTQDVIAWERLPTWVEWVVRDGGGEVWAYDEEPEYRVDGWDFESSSLRIDDWPGIVQIGTVDWRESKQRRPQVSDGEKA